MTLTVGQNGALYGMYNPNHGLSFTTRNLIERRMIERITTGNIQRVVQVVFGNVIDMRDHMNSHPGTNRTHISRPDTTIL